MLSTEFAEFKVNRDGTMDVSPKRFIPELELVRILRMAFMHARIKKIKKPVKWRMTGAGK
jgi:hypothetical protein